MISIREMLQVIGRDAAYTFGARHCPPTDLTHDPFIRASGSNPGFDREDYKGLSVLLVISIVSLGATCLTAMRILAPEHYLAVVTGILGYVFGKGAK